jgi:hypothetical protein
VTDADIFPAPAPNDGEQMFLLTGLDGSYQQEGNLK